MTQPDRRFDQKLKATDIIPVSELAGLTFRIPHYQRGYRWTQAQIEALLSDLADFAENKKEGDYYCLQPLVVVSGEDSYRVVDGQQRLTTLWMLAESLNSDKTFSLAYDRDKVLDTLAQVDISQYDSFDFDAGCWKEYISTQWTKCKQNGFVPSVEGFHLFAAKLYINNWVKNKAGFDKSILNDIRFIWHEVLETKEIEAFENLNAGKIPLTSAELIKGLFLSEFGENNSETPLRQKLIAEEFDSIERQLRRDDFWFFLNRGAKPTSCIGFIFKLIKDLGAGKKYNDPTLGEYIYFHERIHSLHDATKVWEEVCRVFHTLEGWYHNPEIYNLIGFLSACGERSTFSISEIFNKYRSCDTIIQFRDYLLYKCLDTIGWHSEERKQNTEEFLHNNFRYDNGKVRAWRLLLLINVLALNLQETSSKDHVSDITKFSFSDFHHCGWNIEHISPQQAKMEEDMQFGDFRPGIEPGTKLCEIENDDDILRIDPYVAVTEDSIMDISNLTFLNEHINKSVSNASFSQKRASVLKKQSEGYYLPPSSIMVFTKGYTSSRNYAEEMVEGKINFWSDRDREDYFAKIVEILSNDYLNKAKDIKSDGSKNNSPLTTVPSFQYSTPNCKITGEGTTGGSQESFTYSKLLDSEHYDYVIIPKIQREYAQGRDSAEDPRAAEVRKNLLASIFDKMDSEGLDFQIVFGSGEERRKIGADEKCRVFIPIDGQQRLTTLFLLHLYRDKRYSQDTPRGTFIYDTRRAASDFCMAITQNPWAGFPEESPSVVIKRSTWFQQYWRQDPTVDGMLRMLDDIHWKTKTRGDFPDLDLIHFSYYDLGLGNISDNIYLKMNSRGKQLTSFENFKAAFEREFGNLNVVSYQFKKNLDSVWQDAFWNPENPTQVPDPLLLRFIANYLYGEFCTTLGLGTESLKATADALYAISSTSNGEEYVSTSCLLEAINSLGAETVVSNLERLFEAKRAGRIFQPYWGDTSNDILDGSYAQRAAFYGLSLYLRNQTTDGEEYPQWMRFVWNIAENNVTNQETFITTCKLFHRLSEKEGCSDILSRLLSTESEGLSETAQYKEERAKATTIAAPGLRQAVEEAEQYAFFNGAIRFLFLNEKGEVDWSTFDKKFATAKDLFCADGLTEAASKDDIANRVLISYCHYWVGQIEREVNLFSHGKSAWRFLLLSDDYIEPVHNLLLYNSISSNLMLYGEDDGGHRKTTHECLVNGNYLCCLNGVNDDQRSKYFIRWYYTGMCLYLRSRTRDSYFLSADRSRIINGLAKHFDVSQPTKAGFYSLASQFNVYYNGYVFQLEHWGGTFLYDGDLKVFDMEGANDIGYIETAEIDPEKKSVDEIKKTFDNCIDAYEEWMGKQS